MEQAKIIFEKGMTFEIISESGLFPPKEVLNSFFLCGIDDVSSEITLQWTPFSLTQDDYRSLFKHYKEIHPGLKTYDLNCLDFSKWFSSVAINLRQNDD